MPLHRAPIKWRLSPDTTGREKTANGGGEFAMWFFNLISV